MLPTNTLDQFRCRLKEINVCVLALMLADVFSVCVGVVALGSCCFLFPVPSPGTESLNGTPYNVTVVETLCEIST